ncbi:hypothetical protein J2T20_002941 [Paenibacillus wynnii]|nr:hypothetical protein [Paenibacillus wynnii]
MGDVNGAVEGLKWAIADTKIPPSAAVRRINILPVRHALSVTPILSGRGYKPIVKYEMDSIASLLLGNPNRADMLK